MDPAFIPCAILGATCLRAAYGDSFGKVSRILEELYPDGIPVEAYPDALAIVRVLDKLCRLATAKGHAAPMHESPWADVLGYSLLSVARRENDAREADQR